MPKKLLLADDSVTIQKVVAIALASEDFAITTVDNGEDALAKAREINPDIILADVVMPKRNGYEVCEAIKADPALRNIPVLLLAGTFEAFDEGRARSVNADAHIQKPFESQALINKVTQLAPAGPKPLAAVAASAVVPASAPAPSSSSPASVPTALRSTGSNPPAPAAARPYGAGQRPVIPPPPARAPAPPSAVATGRPAPTAGARPAVPASGAARPPPPPPRPGAAAGAGTGTKATPRPPVPGKPSSAPVRSPTAAPSGARSGAATTRAAIPPPPPPGTATVKVIREPPGPTASAANRAGAARPGAVPVTSEFDKDSEDISVGDLLESEAKPAASAAKPAAGGEALLREALSKASREVIERVVWEVVPQLAETIIRGELDRLIKERESKA